MTCSRSSSCSSLSSRLYSRSLALQKYLETLSLKPLTLPRVCVAALSRNSFVYSSSASPRVQTLLSALISLPVTLSQSLDWSRSWPFFRSRRLSASPRSLLNISSVSSARLGFFESRRVLSLSLSVSSFALATESRCIPFRNLRNRRFSFLSTFPIPRVNFRSFARVLVRVVFSNPTRFPFSPRSHLPSLSDDAPRLHSPFVSPPLVSRARSRETTRCTFQIRLSSLLLSSPRPASSAFPSRARRTTRLHGVEACTRAGRCISFRTASSLSCCSKRRRKMFSFDDNILASFSRRRFHCPPPEARRHLPRGRLRLLLLLLLFRYQSASSSSKSSRTARVGATSKRERFYILSIFRRRRKEKKERKKEKQKYHPAPPQKISTILQSVSTTSKSSSSSSSSSRKVLGFLCRRQKTSLGGTVFLSSFWVSSRTKRTLTKHANTERESESLSLAYFLK